MYLNRTFFHVSYILMDKSIFFIHIYVYTKAQNILQKNLKDAA